MHRCLGEILLEEGLVTKEQIQEAMAVWRQPGEERRIGEILVDMRKLSKGQLEEVLAVYRISETPCGVKKACLT